MKIIFKSKIKVLISYHNLNNYDYNNSKFLKEKLLKNKDYNS